MAGDWIKFEKATPDKPEVIAMAAALRLSRYDVVGRLLCVWCWADTISIDGAAVPVPESFIDELVQKKGFAKALRATGWMGGEDYKLTFTNFERHNGTTAKARAENNRRVTNHRQRNGSGKSVTDVTEKPLQKPLPEREKRESRVIPPVVPQGDGSVASRNAETRDRCLPEKWRNLPIASRRRERCLKNSPLMARIGSWFNRRPETLWTVAEGVALFEIKPNEEDVEILEEWYLASNVGDRDIRRRDLMTLLNNWTIDLDRAQLWRAENP